MSITTSLKHFFSSRQPRSIAQWTKLAIPFLAIGCVTTSMADTVQVAVAANFTAPMKEIASEFKKDTGHEAELSFGSTGKIYAQINNGAPFEVFLAADTQRPQKLEEDKQTVTGTRFTYAIGKLALWSAKTDFIDKQGTILKTDSFSHIAIANPKAAPYGQAAMETMEKMGVLLSLANKLVQGENIAQAHQYISTGNAELGFVALSQVFANGTLKSGSVWIVPEDMHTPIKQDAVILKKGENNPASQALVAYLKSEKAKTIIHSYGYDI